MSERFPGYDVLDKRDTLSWNEPTRRTIERRLSIPPGPRYFTETEWETLVALCGRIIPQPSHRAPAPIADYIDEKLLNNRCDGYRFAEMLPQGEAWRAALAALNAEARRQRASNFCDLPKARQDDLIRQMQQGALKGPLWRGMPSELFFSKRALHDVVNAYYSHPTAWSEIGWGGPASPRGYVRLDANRRDPWEAAEAREGAENEARAENRHVL